MIDQACELSIVLPAYHEADSLRTILPALKREAATLTSSFEILVIDAHQAVDDTQALCQTHYVRHEFRGGGNSYGDAVRSGIASSCGEFVIFMDADGSHNPADIALLWNNRHRSDIIIGSRYTEGGKTENPLILIFMSFVVNLIYRLSFKLPARDVTNSFRLYPGRQLRHLTLESDNFDIIEEILIRLTAGSAKLSVMEVPVTFERRKAGESKRNLITFALSYVTTILRLWRYRKSTINKARRTGA